MWWLWIVIIAYLFNAIATLISKWLLIKTIPEPVVFTFYTGILNILALFLIPFGFEFPGLTEVLVALLSGAAYAAAIYYMAKALHVDQASQVAPMIGGLQPIFVIMFVLMFLPPEEALIGMQYIGVGLLAVGSILIGLEIGRKRIFTESIYLIFTSSLLFGLSYALLKLVYIQQEFISGFVWSRIGTVLFVFFLALVPGSFKKIKDSFKQSGEKTKGLFMVGQFFGAISFVMIAYAISLASVAVISALQGVQYAILFLLIILLAKKRPHLLNEPLTKSIVIQKTMAIVIIIIGLALVI